jgi:hypothetical protein
LQIWGCGDTVAAVLADATTPLLPAGAVLARNENEFLAAIRARVAALDVSYDTLDRIAGLPDRFASKLLCDPPMRQISQATLWLLMGALGYKLALIEDAEAFAKVQSRLVKRKAPNRRISTMTLARRRNSPWLFNAESGRAMVSVRLTKLNPKQRIEIARNAARARWKRKCRKCSPT